MDRRGEGSFRVRDLCRNPGMSLLEHVSAAMQAATPGGRRVDFVEQIRRVFAQLDKPPIRAPTANGEVFIGKTEIQVPTPCWLRTTRHAPSG